MSNHQHNLTRIKAVYNALGHLQDQVVFIGGATVSLYVDGVSEEARPTDDIDIIIEIYAYKDYAAIEEQLRKMGFENDTESKVMCRYKVQGIIVDIMPTGEAVLNFTNKWYTDGFKESIIIQIEDYPIKIFSAPYFLASKLEAFRNRGKNDGRTSTDFEDIIFVLENRKSVWEEMKNAPYGVNLFLKDEFKQLLSYKHISEWIDAHAGYGSIPATYFILEELENFILN